MIKHYFKFLFAIIVVITMTFFAGEVFASTDYSYYNNRYYKNNSVMNSFASTSSFVGRYKEVSLYDLPETNYKRLSVSQQTQIKNLANTILENNTSLSSTAKMRKFHDWITSNFYKYSHPERIYSLVADGNNYDNPYYLYKSADEGKIRARSKGFASMLVALARSQGIAARTVTGYYYAGNLDDTKRWTGSYGTIYTWVIAYYNGKWRVIDPYADCSQYYDEINGYSSDFDVEMLTETDNSAFFDPTIDDLSSNHVMLYLYKGSRSIKYISNSSERKQIIAFLNKSYSSKTNGKRVNYNYTPNDSGTWFIKNTESLGDGNGRFVKVKWPVKKGLRGKLSLTGFTKLQHLYAPTNKISSLSVTNCPELRTAVVSYNKMSKIVVTGSKKITKLKTYGNPSTYIKYNFGSKKRTAVIKANTGGTVAVYYLKSNGKIRHYVKATPREGYKFKGWYKGNKLITKKRSFTSHRYSSFTYTAKFTKKSYIYISINKQKLWFYKNGRLVISTSIVTGQKGTHSTPTGVYTLRSKARDVTLIGPDYRSWVDYWMLFDSYNQIGLHDATWRYSFGGNIYKYNGSHGCVNLPYNVAKVIYNSAPVGTKIIVR